MSIPLRKQNPLFRLAIFLLGCVFFNLITSHILGEFAPLKQPLKPDTFFNNGMTSLVSALIFAPIIEEFAFRGFLSTKRVYLLSLPLLIFFMLYSFNFHVLIVIIAIILFAFFLLMVLNEKYFTFVYQHYFNLLIVFSCFSFCAAHIIVIEKYFAFPIALVSCFIVFFPSAYLFAKIRIEMGLKYSMLTHSIHNILILIMNGVIYRELQ